jgi:hypothetical protein
MAAPETSPSARRPAVVKMEGKREVGSTPHLKKKT